MAVFRELYLFILVTFCLFGSFLSQAVKVLLHGKSLRLNERFFKCGMSRLIPGLSLCIDWLSTELIAVIIHELCLTKMSCVI